MEILCFFAGLLFFYTNSPWPLLFVATALALNANRRVIVWFVSAFLWSCLHQWWIADVGMPDERVVQQAKLLGTITSIPESSFSKTSLQFSITQMNDRPVRATALLSCYFHCPSFKPGQLWQLQTKLKKPENLGNPGHFDYEGRLKSRHIQWTGYIKSSTGPIQNVSTFKTRILTLREQLSLSLQKSMPQKSSRGIVEALTLGLTNNLDKAQWDLFRRTGTTHLMVISGAHISLVAGIIYWLLKKLWSLSAGLCRYRPAQQMAGAGAVIIVAGYSLLAGFALPAQRAVIVCVFLMMRHFQSRRFTGWQAWRYALLAVSIYEPHSVLLSGFYLSFLAVALLIACSQRIRYKGIKKALCLQLACLWGLMPLTLYWFSYGAVNGLAANLIAIPLVGYLLVPLSLVSLFAAQITSSTWVMLPVESVIDLLMFCLRWIDKSSSINLTFSISTPLSLISLMLGSMLLYFIPLRLLLLASITLVVAALFPGHSQIRPGEARVDVLDVGQGLSVVITTAGHTLVYDTGMLFYQGSDMAQMAIIPYLASMGIKKIDAVVISHPDLDHRGGLLSLEKAFQINKLLVDNVAFYHRGNACHDYPAWEWDGIIFRFLPIKAFFRDKNNSSCVLQISNRAGKILLPGDIEKLAENYLVNTYGKELESDVLIVAHHGSKTSSSPAFISQTAPKFAIISSGFDNRYHFPHQQTIKTLTAQNTAIYNTATCGMTSIWLKKNQEINTLQCYKRTKADNNAMITR